jgi:predicted MPP superfamily phosphohydrolase
MDHNPANAGEYTTEADLILCGHTHKGQIFPGSLITGMLYTVDHGHYQKDADSPHIIVTSGFGTWGMPMRVGTNCEMVTIRLAEKRV